MVYTAYSVSLLLDAWHTTKLRICYLQRNYERRWKRDRKDKASGFLAVATALKSAELFSKGPTEGRAKVLIEDLEHFLKKF